MKNSSTGGNLAGASRHGLVLVSHGLSARVRLDDGTEVLARAAGRGLQFVCGDEVSCDCDGRHAQWRLHAIGARRSALYRSNARGRAELVAANLSLLVVVVAPRPEPDLFVVDRYLAAAASAGIGALLLAHKADLDFTPAVRTELAALAATGCATLPCSARSGQGLEELRLRLRAATVMLVGQSGVGKSSLLRALVPGAEAAVGELLRSDAGRHTTSAARLYALPGGGALIDSPGVRDFAPAPEMLDERSLGFAEVARLAPHCRFADCRHLQEPHCAVRAAMAAGEMSARRYESYRRLRRLRGQLLARLAPGRR
ncbi:MAG: ribosome small subunit-dependent GTPase A [Gammaproteobacteria bacterium]|nr:ribosome small subunit-dependent GTPase A [Gammaproteobacteria bacterium]